MELLKIKFITLILKNPFRNKTRSILSIIGIAIGIATIVALGVITAGMEDSVQTTLNEGSAEITVSNSSSIGGSTAMLSDELINDLKNMSNVSNTAGELSITETSNDGQMGGPGQGGPNSGISIIGINPDKISLAGIQSINGTLFKNNTNKAIVGQHYSLLNNISIGDNITIKENTFEVTGIYETGSIFTDGGVYVSLASLQNITNTNEISSILIKTTEGTNDTDLSNTIKDKYTDLTTLTSEEMSNMFNNVIGILDTVSLAISGLAILVGAIGIINTMVMTVYERTKEIGVLKSIGWKSRRILAMILGETLVLTTVSGIVGSIFGILIPEIGIYLLGANNFSLGYKPETFLLAFSITIIVGIIGGIYPAYKASKLEPTEALRYE